MGFTFGTWTRVAATDAMERARLGGSKFKSRASLARVGVKVPPSTMSAQ